MKWCKLKFSNARPFLKEADMFRVEKTEYANKTFRLPVELIQKLERLAQDEQVSMNQLVIQCCNYALDHLERDGD